MGRDAVGYGSGMGVDPDGEGDWEDDGRESADDMGMVGDVSEGDGVRARVMPPPRKRRTPFMGSAWRVY